jgi:hypothetical protein
MMMTEINAIFKDLKEAEMVAPKILKKSSWWMTIDYHKLNEVVSPIMAIVPDTEHSNPSKFPLRKGRLRNHR